MVLLGVEPHRDTHTVVAVDQVGRRLDQTTVTARTQGHTELLGWATRAGLTIACGRWRTAATSPAGLNAICWPPASRSCASRPG